MVKMILFEDISPPVFLSLIPVNSQVNTYIFYLFIVVFLVSIKTLVLVRQINILLQFWQINNKLLIAV